MNLKVPFTCHHHCYSVDMEIQKRLIMVAVCHNPVQSRRYMVWTDSKRPSQPSTAFQHISQRDRQQGVGVIPPAKLLVRLEEDQ